MTDQKSKQLWSGALKLLPFWISVGVALLVAGICCLCIQTTNSSIEKNCSTKYEYEEITKLDYRNCTDGDNKLCSEVIVSGELCVCLQPIEIPQNVTGDVVIFYQLDTFNETSIAKTPNFYKSRDDNQLRGLLNDTPSEACKPYDYDDANRTIVPCGALADAMFNDKIGIFDNDAIEYLPSVSYGLLHKEDREGFHNPPVEELSVAFKNFSKPKNWTINIWELDTKNVENNGLQNEAFIAWMRTDWPQKPMWRLDRSTNHTIYKDGIPAGKYKLGIEYNYPLSKYDGPRTLIVKREFIKPDCIDAEYTTQKVYGYDIGVAGVVIGILFLILAAILIVTYKVTANKGGRFHPSVNDSNPPPTIIVTSTRDADNDASTTDKPKTNHDNTERTLLNKTSPNKVGKYTVEEKPLRTDQLKDDDYL